jgi:5'-nucleotidase
MPTRRQFLRNSALLAGALMLPGSLLSAARRKRIVILHTNDFHSRLEPFAANHPKYPGQGGIEKLKTMIDEAAKDADDFLLLDCGDVFQGTAYFNTFGGVPEFEWMNRAGYTASTLGNHDFDMGIDHLAMMIEKYAKFTFVNCNYDLSNSPLKSLVKPYITTKKAGVKIGITGVGIQPEGLIPDHLCKGVVYRDPIHHVQKTVDLLRNKHHCQIVIVLSHLGYQYPTAQIDDCKLAAATQGINFIFGGHTHSFLESPVTIKNSAGKDVTVNQAGWAGLRLGKVVLERN